MTHSIRRAMRHLVVLALVPAAIARAGRSPRLADVQPRPVWLAVQPGRDDDRPEDCRATGGEVAISGQGFRSADRGYPRHASGRQRLRLLRHGHRPDLLQARPDGKLCWTYRKQAGAGHTAGVESVATDAPAHDFRFQMSSEGIMTSALVTEDTVYFGDLGGMFYALDRETGKERWKVNARASDFPGAHPINLFFSSPILVDGKVIAGGGAWSSSSPAGCSIAARRAAGSSWPSSRRPAGSPGSSTSGPSPSAWIRRSRSRTASARTPSITARRPARSGARRLTTRNRARSSSAPT